MTFNPHPKPIKRKRKITYRCSDGSRVSQDQIDIKRKAIYSIVFVGKSRCQSYPHLYANDHDHTISQSRCKQLGKTELIWDIDNIAMSSRIAHKEWESYKSGAFEDHANVIKRMKFLKKHDPEQFEKRRQHLSNYKIMEQLK